MTRWIGLGGGPPDQATGEISRKLRWVPGEHPHSRGDLQREAQQGNLGPAMREKAETGREGGVRSQGSGYFLESLNGGREVKKGQAEISPLTLSTQRS